MNKNLIAIPVLLTLALFASAGECQQWQTSPGGMPYYQYPPAMPDVPGPTVYLMPNGGQWYIGPPAMPGFGSPPPIYIPPNDDDDDDHPHYRSYRHRWHPRY